MAGVFTNGFSGRLVSDNRKLRGNSSFPDYEQFSLKLALSDKVGNWMGDHWESPKRRCLIFFVYLISFLYLVVKGFSVIFFSRF